MIFISTPSHGYLKVSKDKFYPVYENMTPEQKECYGYGYADNDSVYLEEDDEASTFLTASGNTEQIEDIYSEDFDRARRGNMIYNGKPLYYLSDILN